MVSKGALVQLGIHYYWGKGVRKNPIAAIRCFRKATKGKDMCEFERDDAFFYLGIAYLEGKGVTVSIPRARKLLQRANVDNDHPAARRALQGLTRSSIVQRGNLSNKTHRGSSDLGKAVKLRVY
jgi:TPR repeat protein